MQYGDNDDKTKQKKSLVKINVQVCLKVRRKMIACAIFGERMIKELRCHLRILILFHIIKYHWIRYILFLSTNRTHHHRHSSHRVPLHKCCLQTGSSLYMHHNRKAWPAYNDTFFSVSLPLLLSLTTHPTKLQYNTKTL